MSKRSVIVLGGPDSGKTNYIGRLWRALESRSCGLVSAAQPDDLGFVFDTADHLFEGRFAPRTEHSDGRRDFEISVKSASSEAETSIVIPDIRGELWQSAVLESEITADWMDELGRADGALLFVRVQSKLNVKPLDWVTSKRLLQKVGQDEDRAKLPTQVMLSELLRFLELKLANRPDGTRPRVSVIVSAWDLVDEEVFSRGPDAYIQKEYPIFAGRVRDSSRLDIRIFALSVVGGDLDADAGYREAFLEEGLDAHGWVAMPDGGVSPWRKDPDLTLPVAWVVGD